MAAKILTLIAALLALIFIGSKVFKKSIKVYNPLTWGLVELAWYLISFAAVCAGLVEISRIEELNEYREREKGLQQDFQGKKNFLYAQTWLLKSDTSAPPATRESVYWFHKMKTLLDEGWQSNRWEGFVQYSRYYIFKEPGSYADVLGSMSEYNWPVDKRTNPAELFLLDEIHTVVDSLQSLRIRKQNVLRSRPEENTNYHLRYFLVLLYLAGLAMKLLKIYADYRRIRGVK